MSNYIFKENELTTESDGNYFNLIIVNEKFNIKIGLSLKILKSLQQNICEHLKEKGL
jgi:hypothetical protein